MATVRAYKLAEELGIERNEFVEQARQHGIDLKSAMASLEDAEVELLREKIGGAVKAKRSVDEQRLEGKSGTTVVRRRKRKEPDPEPVPEPIAVDTPATAGMSGDDEEPFDALADQDDELGPVRRRRGLRGRAGNGGRGAGADRADCTDGTRLATGRVFDARRVPRGCAMHRGGAAAADAARPDRKGKQRKRVREVVNLQEQEQFAKQITSRGVGQRRTRSGPRPDRSSIRARGAATGSRRSRRAASLANQTKQVRVSGEITVGELAKQAGVKAPADPGAADGPRDHGRRSISGSPSRPCRSSRRAWDSRRSTSASTRRSSSSPPRGEIAEAAEGDDAAAGDHRDGPRRSRQDFAARCDPQDEGHGRRGGRHHAARRRLSGRVRGPSPDVHRHAGPCGLHGHARPRRRGDRSRRARHRGDRRRDAADRRGDRARAGRGLSDRGRDQQVRPARRRSAARAPAPDGAQPRARGFRRRRGLLSTSRRRRARASTICSRCSCSSRSCSSSAPIRRGVRRASCSRRSSTRDAVRWRRCSSRTARSSRAIRSWSAPSGAACARCKTTRATASSRPAPRCRCRSRASRACRRRAPSSTWSRASGSRARSSTTARIASAGRRWRPRPRLTLEEFYAQSASEGPKELSVVLKADVQGTCEAARDALEKLSTEEVVLKVLSSGVGAITENDVNLAAASGAIVVGFNVRPDPSARRAVGQRRHRDPHLLDHHGDARRREGGDGGPLAADRRARSCSVARRSERPSRFPRSGRSRAPMCSKARSCETPIAGSCAMAVQIYQGTVGSLRRFKDDVKEVTNGMECGIGVDDLQRHQGRRRDRDLRARGAGRDALKRTEAEAADDRRSGRHRAAGTRVPIAEREAGRRAQDRGALAASFQRFGGGGRRPGYLAAGRDRPGDGGQRRDRGPPHAREGGGVRRGDPPRRDRGQRDSS